MKRKILTAAMIAPMLTAPAYANTHECYVPMKDWQSRAEVVRFIEAQGWLVRRVRIDDGCVGANRLSHTIDRRTGGPTRSPIASVSVVAATCMEADAWTTALLVKGKVAGPALAEAQRLSTLFVFRENNTLMDLGFGPLFAAPM